MYYIQPIWVPTYKSILGGSNIKTDILQFIQNYNRVRQLTTYSCFNHTDFAYGWDPFTSSQWIPAIKHLQKK